MNRNPTGLYLTLFTGYAHYLRREEASFAAFKSIISGFTPVNPANQPTTSAGGIGSSNGDATQIGVQKRKRTNSSAQTSGKQKDANVSSSRKVRKFEQPSGTKLQDISKNLRRTKTTQVTGIQLFDELKGSLNERSNHTTPGVNIHPDLVLSRHTLQKLEGFRYQSSSLDLTQTYRDAYSGRSLDIGATRRIMNPEAAGDDENALARLSAPTISVSSLPRSEVSHRPEVLDESTLLQQGYKNENLLHSHQQATAHAMQPPSAYNLNDFDKELEIYDILPPSNQEQSAFRMGGQIQSHNKGAMFESDGCSASYSNMWAEASGSRDGNEVSLDAKYGGDEFPMDDEGLEEMLQLTEYATEQVHTPTDHIMRNSVKSVTEANESKGYENHFSQFSSPLDAVDEAILSSFEDGSTFLKSPTIQPPSPYSLNFPTTNNALNAEVNETDMLEDPEDLYDDDDLDRELMNLASSSPGKANTPTPPSSPRPTTPKLQWMPPTCYIPAKRRELPQPSSVPPAPTPRSAASSPILTPFIRKPFPRPVRDRSPILGLHPRAVLRTCFRIGEALNAASAASRSNTDAVIELYARVVYSEREAGSIKQVFQFADIFTSDRPPFLTGTYTLWKGVSLWDHDAKTFLGEDGKGKMARVVGRIRKGGGGKACEMRVLSVWECDWEDVEIARGVVCA